MVGNVSFVYSSFHLRKLKIVDRVSYCIIYMYIIVYGVRKYMYDFNRGY